MKHSEQQTSSTLCSVLYLVHPKSSSIFQSCEWLNLTRLLLRKKKKKKKKKTVKKTAFRSGLPICHELWDIAFIFYSLTTYYNCASSDIHTCSCIALFAVRNAGYKTSTWFSCVDSGIHICDNCSLYSQITGVQCNIMLQVCIVVFGHVAVLSLCSQECWSTMYSPTFVQIPVFTHVVALFSLPPGTLEYNAHSPITP